MSETWNTGDIITPIKRIKGLRCGQPYKIGHIDRCLDGAYSWDDLFLEGKSGSFCEFDFKRFVCPN